MGRVVSRESRVARRKAAAHAAFCTLRSLSARCGRLVLPTYDSRLPTHDLRLVQPEIPELHTALELRVPTADRLGPEGNITGVADLDRRDLGVMGFLDRLEDRHARIEIGLGEQ